MLLNGWGRMSQKMSKEDASSKEDAVLNSFYATGLSISPENIRKPLFFSFFQGL